MQLTYRQKLTIVIFKEAGYKVTEIIEKTGVQRRTINRVLKKYEEEGTLERKQGSGRPAKFDERGARHLISVILKDRRLSLHEIIASIPEEASISTVKKVLHEEGYFNRVARRKPYLSNSHVARRLKFAKEHVNWDVEMWKKVIWTDESSFEIGKKSGQVHIWRKAGEAYKTACLAGTHKSERNSVMIWGAIRFGEKSELVFMNKKERKGSDLVRNVYDQALLRFWNHNPDLLLMEDGAPTHRCAVAKKWKKDQVIECLEWPAQSPDLNPIENLWKQMKDRVQSKSEGPVNEGKFRELIQEAWDSFDPSTWNKLIETMPRRMKEVIRNKGGSTHW